MDIVVHMMPIATIPRVMSSISLPYPNQPDARPVRGVGSLPAACVIRIGLTMSVLSSSAADTSGVGNIRRRQALPTHDVVARGWTPTANAEGLVNGGPSKMQLLGLTAVKRGSIASVI